MDPVIVTSPLGDNPPKASLYYGQDVIETLKQLPDASVHMVCTSPPYWGLRDYGTGDAQIGLEDSPKEFVTKLVEVFREVARVLRPDGTLWVNLGDNYSSGNRKTQCQPTLRPGQTGVAVRPPVVEGIKPKDLVGIPWEVAFALRADGWFLRSDIIWAKPSCMPESVRDRPTKSHEYVFLFAHPDSGGNYFYDYEAIREQPAGYTRKGGTAPTRDGLTTHGQGSNTLHQMNPNGRNKRTVWNVNPKPFSGAHFAVWPPELVETMIKAGTSEYGVCGACGAPWQRIVESTSLDEPLSRNQPLERSSARKADGSRLTSGTGHRTTESGVVPSFKGSDTTTVGWEPTCVCEAAVARAVVLDPFSGSGTTGMVALSLGRDYLGIDLNPDYLDMACERILGDRVSPDDPVVGEEPSIMDLFGA